jgi:hypothetical protein
MVVMLKEAKITTRFLKWPKILHAYSIAFAKQLKNLTALQDGYVANPTLQTA